MEDQTTKGGLSTGAVAGIALIVAIVFGGGAYAYVNSKATKDKEALNAQITELQSQVSSATTATTVPTTSTSATAAAKTYSNSTFGFSFVYPTGATVKELATALVNDKGGSKVVSVTTSDFTAEIYVAKLNASGANGGSNVIGLYRSDKLSDSGQVSKTTSLVAKNFSFSLLDVSADPSYVSAFANLGNTLADVTFTSITGKGIKGVDGTAYKQSDLPQSATDFLSSFSKL
ncbi:MAG: hypothetical protein NTW79_01915 [Candidatus Berkelbacteria bacterium]|nr:hypothetical protein [Candidatus Berkelbacteria bacterium]